MTAPKRDTGEAPAVQPDFLAMAHAAMRDALPLREIEAQQKRDLRPERAQRLDASGVRPYLKQDALGWLYDDTLPLPTQALRVVQGWRTARKGKSMAAIVGPRGVGKTVACAWLIAQVGGAYVTAKELCALHASRTSEAVRRFEQYMDHNALVVDDVGTEDDAAEARSLMYALTNGRQGRGWTVLTGNMLEKQFYERYDLRATDRLFDCGQIIGVQGPNLRRAD